MCSLLMRETGACLWKSRGERPFDDYLPAVAAAELLQPSVDTSSMVHYSMCLASFIIINDHQSSSGNTHSWNTEYNVKYLKFDRFESVRERERNTTSPVLYEEIDMQTIHLIPTVSFL